MTSSEAIALLPPMEIDQASDDDFCDWFGEDIVQLEVDGRLLDVGWYGGRDGVFGCRDLDATTIAPESWGQPPELATRSTAEAREWLRRKLASTAK